MARLWARTTTFDSVDVGDELPILVKWETGDTIMRFRSLVCEDGDVEPENNGTDDVDGVGLASQAVVAYVTELLEKGFPLQAIMAKGSSLAVKSLGVVKPEDTISLSGWVTAKHGEGNSNIVECLVRIENQDNVAVAEAVARIAL